MTVEKLERVLWRVRKNNAGRSIVTRKELETAVMKEIGTDKRTYQRTLKALKKLGWIVTNRGSKVLITDKDLE